MYDFLSTCPCSDFFNSTGPENFKSFYTRAKILYARLKSRFCYGLVVNFIYIFAALVKLVFDHIFKMCLVSELLKPPVALWR